MKPQSGRNQHRGGCLAPTDFALLADPLEFIAEDHLREREVCAALDRIATAPQPSAQDVASALAFLGKELPLHLSDEEEDLFPLMRRCCLPEDEIGRMINRLVQDHHHASVDTPEVISLLEGLGSAEVTEQERQLLRRYSSYARRHLILENAVVLPIARLRLSESDLESLRLRMMQRRGIRPRTKTPDHA